ncbi:MAG: DinB family protein [Pyrinomonadaceae bacterium]
MINVAGHFISEARRYLSSSYLPKIERSLEALTDEDVWWRAGEESNSIGNLVLHLDGSTRMWIVSGVGGETDHRLRQQEFDERAHIPRADLLARLKTTLAEVDAVLARVNDSALLEKRRIREHDYTVLEAVFHAVEHFAMHTGQIIMLAKMRAGVDLRLSD